MNHSGRSPMLGDSPLIRLPDGREDAASFVMPELHGSNDSLIDTNFTLYGDITVNPDVDVLAGIVSLHADGNNVYKPVQVFQPVESISRPGRMRSSSSIDDVAKLIEEEMNRDITSYEFRVMENGKSRCTTHTNVKGVLYCMPNKDIPIEVTGAQAGQVVKLGLRYTTGVHHNTPVQACKLHSDGSDPFYSFSIPKCNVIKYEDENHHLMVKIPVTDNISSEGNFSFSLVFRCLNSCHRDKGKDQEIILKLCDVNDKVLKETSINVRVCKNVNRDVKQEGHVPKQRKRNSNGKMKNYESQRILESTQFGSLPTDQDSASAGRGDGGASCVNKNITQRGIEGLCEDMADSRLPSPKIITTALLQELPLKKVKTEMEVHEGTGAAATPTPFPYLPLSKIERIRVQVELPPSGLPTLREFVKFIRGQVLSSQGEEEVDGTPIDPLFCPY